MACDTPISPEPAAPAGGVDARSRQSGFAPAGRIGHASWLGFISRLPDRTQQVTDQCRSRARQPSGNPQLTAGERALRNVSWRGRCSITRDQRRSIYDPPEPGLGTFFDCGLTGLGIFALYAACCRRI